MKAAAAFLSIAAASLLGACSRDDCPQPTPRPLENQSLGDPCGRDGNCADGLTCAAVYAVPGYTAPSFTANVCTATCDGGCPTGGTCATVSAPQPDGGDSPFVTCLRACSSDSDCAAATGASVCDAGVCQRLQCTKDDQCPSGSVCEVPAIVCCPTGAHCLYAGPVPGFCRKAP